MVDSDSCIPLVSYTNYEIHSISYCSFVVVWLNLLKVHQIWVLMVFFAVITTTLIFSIVLVLLQLLLYFQFWLHIRTMAFLILMEAAKFCTFI